MPVGRVVAGLAAGNGRGGHQRVAAIEIGHLVAEADDDALFAGAGRDIAPDILAGLQRLGTEGVEHVVARLDRGIGRRNAGFVGFESKGRSGSGQDARSRQRKRKG